MDGEGRLHVDGNEAAPCMAAETENKSTNSRGGGVCAEADRNGWTGRYAV